jgi:hypothetical protein
VHGLVRLLIAVEISQLIQVLLDAPRQSSRLQIRLRGQVDRFDARRDPVLEDIDDRKIVGQILSELMADVMASLGPSSLPDRQGDPKARRPESGRMKVCANVPRPTSAELRTEIWVGLGW